MSANIDTMMYVGEVPWHGLGHQYETPPETPEEIIIKAEMDWTVNSAKMYTDMHQNIPNYHAVYREDNNSVLGVVNKPAPILTQNIDAFKAFGGLLGDEIVVDTAASLGRGESIFGCFKINERYKVLDDDIDHYFVVLNEHLRADGKITILNTPVRVVCQNTLSAALNNNIYKMRIPVSKDVKINEGLAKRIIEGAAKTVEDLSFKSLKMYNQKIDRGYVDRLLDELFPYIKAEGNTSHQRANDVTTMMRETFLTECMGADNLQNYRGTRLQVFNALTDYSQHYHKNAEKAFDLNYKMKLLPGLGTDTPSNLVNKFLKVQDKVA